MAEKPYFKMHERPEDTLREWQRTLNHIIPRLNTTTAYISVDSGALTIGDIAVMSSAQLAARISDETGTGLAVFGTSPTFTTQITTPKVVSTDDFTLDCGANKTLVLSDIVYNDVQFAVTSGKVPAVNAPTWEAFTTNTAAYAFSVDDYIDLQTCELEHWWKQGTNGDLHVHFTIKTAQSTGSNRFVKFTAWVSYADNNEAWVEQSPLSAEYTVPTGSAALKNFYLDMGDVTLTNYLIGAQVKVRIKRIAATGGTEYADDVYITQVGMHLQTDTIGSRTETVK